MRKLSNDTVPVRPANSGMIWSTTASSVWVPTAQIPIEMTILGEPASKSNSREFSLNRRTGQRFSRKSDKAQSFVGSFLAQVPPEFKGLMLGSEKTPLRANVSVWYASYKPDVDVELVFDCLQLAKVVSNDRWIREKHIYGHIDKANPRIEIRIEEI
jgi:Holliday junction resolvase RusA-like endonuclease